MTSLRTLALFVCASGSMLSATALAQPAGARNQDFLYQTQPGDTIFDIATRFATAKDWDRLVRLNNIADPKKLTPGTTVRIPLSMIEKDPTAARVLYQKGDVHISKRNAPVSGNQLERGTEIRTGLDGYLSLELLDGSTILILPNAELRIEQATEFRRAGLQDFVILLEKGQIEPNVDPSGKGVGRFEIRTPRAVTGVRGTRFRVGVTDDIVTGEVLKGAVEVHTRGKRQRLTVLEGQGLGASARGLVSETLLGAPAIQVEAEPGFGDVRLRYEAVPDAVAYRVQLSRDAAFTQVLDSRATAQLEHIFPDLEDGDYFVKVRAMSAAGIEGLERVERVTVAARPLPPLTLDGLHSSDGWPRSKSVAWTMVPDSAGYELEWWAKSPDNAPRMRVPLTPDSTSFEMPQNGVLWRIRTLVERDGMRVAGPWSESHTAGTSNGQARSPKVQWRPRANMTGQLEIVTAVPGDAMPLTTVPAVQQVALPPLPPGDYIIRQRYIDRQGAPRMYAPGQRLRIGSK